MEQRQATAKYAKDAKENEKLDGGVRNVTLPQPKAISHELTRINTNKSWVVVAPGMAVYRDDFDE
ncbi:MAG TPA: hypothetical protein VNW97_07125 [Candidatus Saccharimonadales bacterium]|jgi:hypothetical protein|nr:hypothetical protein [Candidatus Saccharimonadales bacterium]